MDEATAWALALAVLGAIAGSFIAAVVVRWPAGRSVLRGRSACDACGTTLRAGDLVPLLSAMALRGRCRSCAVPIDPVHWRIELVGMAIGAAAGWVAPGGTGVAGALFGWLLLALAALDIVAFWLPDRLTLLLAIGGIVTGALAFAPSLADRIAGGMAGYGILSAVAWSYRRIRGREGMGGGDPKLIGAIGLWLGWRVLPAVLLIAGLAGLGVVLFAQWHGRAMTRDTALPFGALLAGAAYASWIAMIDYRP